MAFNPATVEYISQLGVQLTTRQFRDAVLNVEAHAATPVTQEDLDEYNRTRAGEPAYIPITLESWAALVGDITRNIHLV